MNRTESVSVLDFPTGPRWPQAVHPKSKRVLLKRRDDLLVSMTLGGLPFDSFVGRWYVAQIWGGKEKEFARQLTALQLPYFIPFEHVRRKDYDRRQARIIQRPLFSGYGFFCGGDNERYRVLDTKLCVGNRLPFEREVLSCAMQGKLRWELSAIYRALESNPVLPAKLPQVGRNAEIVSGALRGVTGKVISHAGGTQLVLTCTMLNQQIPVEIDASMVESI